VHSPSVPTAESSISLSDEMKHLVTECQEARERARVEIDRAMEALRRTSPAWTGWPAAHRYVKIRSWLLCVD
jgi:hypothetical protein